MKQGIFIATGWLLCGACADDAALDVACTLNALTAVVVEIVGDQPVSAVTATHGGTTTRCYPTGPQDAGINSKLACIETGWPSGGTYTINVHGSTQRWTQSVEVEADQCHVTAAKTVTIDLAAKPAGAAELADCNDGSGRRPGYCCIEMPPEGACSAEGLDCSSRCDFATPEAKTGTRSAWSCRHGQWSEDGESRCIREGVRKDDPDLRSN